MIDPRLIPAALAFGIVFSAHAAVPVTVAPLSSQLVDLEVRAPAVVLPANEAVLTAQITALVRSVEADVGAAVAKGELLIRLDEDDARLALARARAALAAVEARIAQARLRLERGEDLYARSFISDDELDERRTTLSVLRAEHAGQQVAVKSAELALSRTRIEAPYDATVVARAAQVGSLARPGTPLITLAESGNREVDADLDPRHAERLGRASRLRFVSRGRAWPLTLARLSSVIDRDTRIRKGRFRFVDDAAVIGASGEVVWLDAAALVPVSLIVQRDEALGVFVADGGTARFVPLPQAQEGRPAPVNLPPDTLLVVRGQARLQDGDALSVTQP